MKLNIIAGSEFLDVTEAQLCDAFKDGALLDEGIILSRNAEFYIQTIAKGDGAYILECRLGNAERHYTAKGNFHKEDVLRAFQWFLTKDVRWIEEFPWPIKMRPQPKAKAATSQSQITDIDGFLEQHRNYILREHQKLKIEPSVELAPRNQPRIFRPIASAHPHGKKPDWTIVIFGIILFLLWAFGSSSSSNSSTSTLDYPAINSAVDKTNAGLPLNDRETNALDQASHAMGLSPDQQSQNIEQKNGEK